MNDTSSPTYKEFFKVCDIILALNVDIWGHSGSKGPSNNRKNAKGSVVIYQDFVSHDKHMRLQTRFGTW